MIFKKIELSDWKLIEGYCRVNNLRQLNYSFEVLYLWRDVCDFEICECDGFLFIKTCFHGKHNFLYPLGEGDITKAFQLMEEYCIEKGIEFVMYQVNAQQKAFIEETFHNKYQLESLRSEFEYIFETERLSTLQGKKLQAKRNHTNFFEKSFNWSFESITEETLLEVMIFAHKWDSEAEISAGSSLNMENMALMNSIESFTCLDLHGGILRVDGKIVAFAIGCPLSTDTYMILFEKADASVRGAYAMINREYVRYFCTNYRYVNRAEDNDDEGLRKAKLSYYPDILQEVFVLKKS
ncbi:MAG: phosphatidylglycerol lysyltransferase domain-containing protein [Bacteroidales bacterium]|nr:phosphatidylglycerol lysyltransferase domain-containing protein [Bacteroidales bacterium]